VRSLGRYLLLIGRPIPLAGDVATVVQAVAIAVAAVAGGTVLGVTVSRSAAVVGVLAILLLLVAVAGLRLQFYVDERGPLLAVEQDIMGAWEEVMWSLDPFVGQGVTGAAPSNLESGLVESVSRTEAYVRLVLGPVAASRLADHHTGYPSQRAVTEAYTERLLAIAEQIGTYTVRVSRSELGRAGRVPGDNGLRRLMAAHPREPGTLRYSGSGS
jgi:hypothetical protein